MKADILIHGGTVIDPARGIHEQRDVAIRHGKFLEIPMGEPVEAGQILPAQDHIVTPGLIDLHTHINYLGSANGLPGDTFCLPNGVTAVADAGSIGVSNYRALLHQTDAWMVKTRFFINVSAGGQIMSKHFPEPLDPSKWEDELFQKAFEDGRGRILGLKVRTSKKVVGELGLKPLKAAIELARRFSMPLVVHPTDPPVPMGELAELLDPGSILCHIFQGVGMTCIENGHLSEGLLQARERGVIYDVAHGRLNFSFPVARTALNLGLEPDTISTDASQANWNKTPMVSLPVVMGKFLVMGMSLDRVIEKVTCNPARILGQAGKWGTMAPGTCADAAIIKIQNRPVIYQDCFGNEQPGEQVLSVRATILDGKLVYRAAEMM
ncbi:MULTISPECIES: amidohydrolase family protein [Eubacteriales]|uniref:amidohydrolase family protein n=1 Tax=Eubacteriales TaxID=186802 RepID=UPI000821973C|nr:amidohydrolase family protein [Muriventricola aceti]MCU6702879.1 amidohydrolase family protein [Muriventricola aceti]SCJ25388.1 Dihydroorotase [uncultured Flavonifractor sp.]